MDRPALLRRLPRLRWTPPPAPLLVPPDAPDRFPQLADDLARLEEELVPAFAELDRQAQREQNRYRRQQLLILVGGFVTTVLGAVQAGLGDEAWPGVLIGISGAAVGSLTFVARQRGSQRAYLHARLRAEQLRSLFFLYLGRVDGFADPAERTRRLVAAVESIRHAPVPP